MSNRIACQFSCGAASAVATKLALAEYSSTHEVQIINAFLTNEEADNRRFAQDCEAWFGQPITVLRDEKYGADAHEVFRRDRPNYKALAWMADQLGRQMPLDLDFAEDEDLIDCM